MMKAEIIALMTGLLMVDAHDSPDLMALKEWSTTRETISARTPY